MDFILAYPGTSEQWCRILKGAMWIRKTKPTMTREIPNIVILTSLLIIKRSQFDKMAK